MENTKLLTVVVPTYNMEKLLHKCLDSLILPTLEERKKLEVLVINDGSKDKSLDIMRSYERKYPETFQVIDKPNGGHGSCWNYGKNNANGLFISFLDSDDWYNTQTLREIIASIPNIKADAILLNHVDYIINKGSVNQILKGKHHDLKNGVEYDCKEYNLRDKSPDFFIFWHTIFRTERLRSVDFNFVERISYDDILLHLVAIYTIRNFVYYNSILYYYLIGREGQSIGEIISKRKIENIKKAHSSIYDFYDKYILDIKTNMSENSAYLAHKDMVISTRNIFKNIYLLPYFEAVKEKKQAISELSSFIIFEKIYSKSIDYYMPVFVAVFITHIKNILRGLFYNIVHILSAKN